MNPTNLDLLKSTAIFEDLSDDDLQVIGQRLISLDFEAGDLLFREGAPGRFICFLLEGELEVRKRTGDGEDASEVAIAALRPGSSVGEMSIIDGLTCSATVLASTPATVMALTKDDFNTLLDEFPRVGANVFRGISRHLSMSLRRTSDDLAALKRNAGN